MFLIIYSPELDLLNDVTIATDALKSKNLARNE